MSEIINKLGKNHTTPAVVDMYNKGTYDSAYGVYTYKGYVYVINQGSDDDFESYDEQVQKYLIDAIEKGDYKLNKAFQ